MLFIAPCRIGLVKAVEDVGAILGGNAAAFVDNL